MVWVTLVETGWGREEVGDVEQKEGGLGKESGGEWNMEYKK